MPKNKINTEHELRNFLAIIHRDGGHYVTKHGLHKAITDATTILHEYRQQLIEIGFIK